MASSKTVGKLNVRLGMDISAFNKSMNQFKREMKQVDAQLGGLKVLAWQTQRIGQSLTTSLTVPIAALGYAAKKSFDAVDEGLDAIAISSGATGKELAELHESFKRVGREVPNNLGQVGTVIGDLNTYLGATGQVLEDLTKKISKSTYMLKEDTVGATVSISRAVNKWGLEARQATRFVDQLFVAGQKFGIGMTKIADQLTTNQVQLKKMGFSLEESIALLGHFEKSGVNTQQVLAAMSRAMASMARSGIENTETTFGALVDKIKNTGSEAEAAAIALEVFGARAGPMMAAEIRAGRFEITELVKDFRDVGDVIDKTFDETADSAEILAAAKNTLAIALEPLGREIDKLARTLLPPLIKGIANLAEKFENLSQPVKSATVLFGGFLALLGPGLITFSLTVKAIEGIVYAVKALAAIKWGTLLTNLGLFLGKWVAIAAAVALAAGAISGIVELVKSGSYVDNWLNDYKARTADDDKIIKGLMEGKKDPFKGTYLDSNVKSYESNFDVFQAGFTKPFEWLVGKLTSVTDQISNAVGGIKVPEPELDFSNMESELDKLLNSPKVSGAIKEKTKTAGEVFREEFSKIWEELWEKPYNLGQLDTLEKQLNQLKYLESQIKDRVRKSILVQGVEIKDRDLIKMIDSSSELADVWDQIFNTQKEIIREQIKLSKASGLSREEFGDEVYHLIRETLLPLAKTSKSKLELYAFESEETAAFTSQIFSDAIEKFNYELDKKFKLSPDLDEIEKLEIERALYTEHVGEALDHIRKLTAVTGGMPGTKEQYSHQIALAEAEKAFKDKIAHLNEREDIAVDIWHKERQKKLEAILENVADLSREELQKYWDEALKLAEFNYEKINEINELFEKQDRVLKIDEWYAALDDMSDVIGRFNRQAGDSVRNFRDIMAILRRMPEITQSIETSFGEVRENINQAFESILGPNNVGNYFSAAAGMGTFGQGSTGTNWVGGIAGTLAGAGIGGPVMAGIAVASQMINAIFPGEAKDTDAEQLQKQIKEYNKILDEWGADFRSDNVSFKEDGGFLGWRHLFGNVKWETIGKEAAEKGAEIAQRLINAMTNAFNTIGSGAFDALFKFGGIDSLTKSVGQSLQSALMEAILNTELIKGPMQALSAYIAEATIDGLTSAEITHIKNMAGELWNSLEPYEDIAKEIADQFGLAEDSAKGIGAALRNVPSGFKIALERFTAATGVQIDTMRGMTMESNRTQIVIQGDVYGLDDFERKVEGAVDKAERRRRTRVHGVWAGAY